MKKLFLLSLIVLLGFSLKAQEPIFLKGDKVVNLGVGIGATANVSLSGEVGILDGIADKGSIGVGGIVGIGTNLLGSRYSRYSRFAAAARGLFHYPFLDKLDTYGGIVLGVGYYHYNSSYAYHANYAGAIYGLVLGGRYYFSDKMSFFGEVGAGMDYLTLGIAFKL